MEVAVRSGECGLAGKYSSQRCQRPTWQIWSYRLGWRSQNAWKAIRLLMVAARGGSSSAARPPNSSASTWAWGRLRPVVQAGNR